MQRWCQTAVTKTERVKFWKSRGFARQGEVSERIDRDERVTRSVTSVQPNGGSPVTRLSVLIAVRRSVTWTALTVVSPGLTVASEKIIENAAVTDWTPLIASLHVAVPLQAPRQVLKLA